MRPSVSTGFMWTMLALLAPLLMLLAAAVVRSQFNQAWSSGASYAAALLTLIALIGVTAWYLRHRRARLERPPARLSTTALTYTPQGEKRTHTLSLSAVRSLNRIAGHSLYIDCGDGPRVLSEQDFVAADALDVIAAVVTHAIALQPDGRARLDDIGAKQHLLGAIRARRALVTLTMLAAIALLFGIEVVMGATTDAVKLLQLGGNSAALVRAGQWWRLVTAGLLHANVQHFIFNALALSSTGAILEKLVGRARFIVIALTASIAGNLASMLFGSHGMSVGASSLIFGLLGALLVVQRAKRASLPPVLIVPPRQWLFLLGVNGLISLLPGIDLLAHVGGFVSGVVVGALCLPGLDVRAQSSSIAIRTLATALVMLFAACQVHVLQRGAVATDAAMPAPATSNNASGPSAPGNLRQMPGFAIALPDGDITRNTQDYRNGRVQVLRHEGGQPQLFGLAWQPGTVVPGALDLLAEQIARPLGARGKPRPMPLHGVDGKPVAAVVIATDSAPMHVALLGCGNRMIELMAMGSAEVDAVFARMVASFECHPDAAQEAAVVTQLRLPLVLTLPGWSVTGRDASGLTLSDGSSLLLLARTDGELGDDAIAITMSALGAKLTMGKPRGDRRPFSGTLADNQVHGWYRQVDCGSEGHALEVAFASDASTADDLAERTASGRCLRSGEAVQVWPEASPPAQPQLR